MSTYQSPLHFIPVTWSERELIDRYRKDFRSCQFNHSFVTFWLWREVGAFWLAECQGFLLIKARFGGSTFFLNPIGDGDISMALRAMEEHAGSEGFPFSLIKLTQERLDQIEATCPNRYHFNPNREDFEYIYLSDKLATLSGKKLQSKRNHINALEKEHTWIFEPIDRNNMQECRQMLDLWSGSQSNSKGSIEEDNRALELALEDYERLGLSGGLIRIDGRVVAFSLGCPICVSVFYVLFERALPEVRGSYPLINREFVRHFATEYPYVNRAEDVGDLNLRKAKLSYYPEILLELYTATLSEPV